MFARTHTLETTAESHDRGLELLQEVLPWLRNSNGFRGLLRLTNADRSRTLVITLWADEESMRQTWDASERFGEVIAETTGTTILGLEDYEVTFAEIAQ